MVNIEHMRTWTCKLDVRDDDFESCSNVWWAIFNLIVMGHTIHSRISWEHLPKDKLFWYTRYFLISLNDIWTIRKQRLLSIVRIYQVTVEILVLSSGTWRQSCTASDSLRFCKQNLGELEILSGCCQISDHLLGDLSIKNAYSFLRPCALPRS